MLGRMQKDTGERQNVMVVAGLASADLWDYSKLQLIYAIQMPFGNSFQVAVVIATVSLHGSPPALQERVLTLHSRNV